MASCITDPCISHPASQMDSCAWNFVDIGKISATHFLASSTCHQPACRTGLLLPNSVTLAMFWLLVIPLFASLDTVIQVSYFDSLNCVTLFCTSSLLTSNPVQTDSTLIKVRHRRQYLIARSQRDLQWLACDWLVFACTDRYTTIPPITR